MITLNGLSEAKIELITHSPIEIENPNGVVSILDMILENYSEDSKFTLINHMLMYCISKSNVTNFQALKLELENYRESVAAIVDPPNEDQFLKIFNTQINVIEELYINISESLFNTRNTQSIFNTLPMNVLTVIASKLCSSSLVGVQEELIQPLVKLFLKFSHVEPEKIFALKMERLDKLAKLSFREWRHNHFTFFHTLFPKREDGKDRKDIKDRVACLAECFAEKNITHCVSLELRTKIIQTIGKLDKLDNKQEILDAIDQACNSSRRLRLTQ